MSKLIRREDVETEVDVAMSEVLPGRSKPGSVAWRMRDAALDAIRALPAIGTCKDCAEWCEDQFVGDSCKAANAPMPWRMCAVTNNLRERAMLLTKPDHYCAAFKRRPTDG